VRFYLGAHHPHWLERAPFPPFVSHRRLAARRRLPRATTGWALDSGGFTELRLHGGWRTTPADARAQSRLPPRQASRRPPRRACLAAYAMWRDRPTFSDVIASCLATTNGRSRRH
jgi:hypothetical protein